MKQHTKKQSFITFLLSFCLLILPPVVKIQAEKITTQEEKREGIAKYSRLILAGLFLELLYLTADEKTDNSLIQQAHLQSLLKNFAEQYASHFFATACHEFGHALTAKILQGDQINIHLGANSKDKNGEALLSTTHLSLDGLMPTAGHTIYSNPNNMAVKLLELAQQHCKENNIELSALDKDELSILLHKLINSPQAQEFTKDIPSIKKKQAAILLAGGTFGIIGHYLLKTLIAFAKNKNSSCFKEALTLDSITINQLFNMFIPFGMSEGSKSDAFKLYTQCFDVSPSMLEKISKITPLLPIAAESYLALHNGQDGGNAQLHSIILLALLNHQLRGFLRFQT